MFSKQIGRGPAKYHLENIQYAPQIQMNPPKSGETPTSTKRRIKKIARKPASPHQGKKSVMVFHVFTLTLDSSFMLVGKD